MSSEYSYFMVSLDATALVHVYLEKIELCRYYLDETNFGLGAHECK